LFFMRIISALLALAFASSTAVASPSYVGEDFTYNQYNGMPANELAVAAYYDGDGQASAGIEVFCAGSGREWIVLEGLTAGLQTFAYDLQDCLPTGKLGVRDGVPNGVVDGVAISMFYKDSAGDAHILRSNEARAGQHVLGVWPTGFASDSAWIDAAAPQVSGGRHILRTILPGSVLLSNGVHRLTAF
jgi:hypothetical protein